MSGTQAQHAPDVAAGWSQPFLEVGYSPWKLALIGLGVVAFVALGIALLWTDELYSRIVGAVSIAFFGGGAIAVAMRMPLTGGIIRIDARGIVDRRICEAPLPWQEIKSLCFYRVHRNRMLAVLLRDEDGFLAREPGLGGFAAKLNRAVGFPGINLALTGLNKPVEDIVYAVAQFCPDMPISVAAPDQADFVEALARLKTRLNRVG